MASLAERIRAYDVADYSGWLDCVTNAQRAAESLDPSIGQARVGHVGVIPSRKAWWFRDNLGSIGRKQPNASLVTTNWVSVGIRDKAAWCVTDLQQRASHPWAHRRDGRMGPPRRSSRPAPCSRPRTPARRPRECYLQTRSGPINISRFRKSVEDAICPDRGGRAGKLRDKVARDAHRRRGVS